MRTTSALRFLFPLSMLSIVLVLASACGTNSPTPTGASPSSSSAITTTIPPGESLYVLDGARSPANAGAQEMRILAFQPGSAHPTTLLTLPSGLTSADHLRIYRATPQGNQTTISIINTRTGATLRTFAVAGVYSTANPGYDNAVLSANGHWLALRSFNQLANSTTIALVDTQKAKVAKTLQLDGDYRLDAIPPDGSRIYLLQQLDASSGHYSVRLYDVTQNQLYPYAIVDKTIPNDIMLGTSLTRQMAPDGTIAYTLYTDTIHNIAFVHILPMTGTFMGARCIDLPVGKVANLLNYYTLTLAPDGSTLYAANGALGIVSRISLQGDQVFDDNITARGRFDPGAHSGASVQSSLSNGAALTHDGHTLYFAGMNGVWAVSTSDLKAHGHYLAQQSLTSIALSADSQTLYAADPSQGITLLAAATGQPLQVLTQPAQAPWSIEWVMQ